MSSFTYSNGQLHVEWVPLPELAKRFGTPLYVYSKAAIERNWLALDNAFGEYPHRICYAVKANSNLAILNLLAKQGSGFDIVSGGELERVIAAGGDPSNSVFSGVAKSKQEIVQALTCGKDGVRCINIESHAELLRVQAVAAELNKQARIGIRINPDVDASTHPYIATGLKNAKFGLMVDAAFDTYQAALAMPNISIHGMACHIGSQITELTPFKDAVRHVSQLIKRLAENGISIQQLDLGGGLGIDYQCETEPAHAEYVGTLINELRANNVTLPITIEPGRSIVGNAGVLLTQVEYLKLSPSKNFAIVDAGMNDLMRPSLYQAYHRIDNVTEHSAGEYKPWDIVGPVCESSDVLGEARKMKIDSTDLLAVRSTGAYAYAMASNYNSRPRPAEVLVDGHTTHLIRSRETIADLFANEHLI